MGKKKELLDHYADYYYRHIKGLFPMLIDEIDIKQIKENNNDIEKASIQREEIDNIFKDKICEYLNSKFDIVKRNIQFLENEYDRYDFDYELCDKLLWFINYKWVKFEKNYPELVDDFTIEDSKELVREFYTDLLKDNPNDVNIINHIIDNKINVEFDESRAETEVKTKEINIAYNSSLLFLIVLAHEISHSYAYFKKDDLLGSTDIRGIEIESSFIEKLFIKYLIEKGYPIIRDGNSSRPVTEEDYETYFTSIFQSVLTYAYRIIDEKDFIENLDEEFEINRDTFNTYLKNSPYEHNYVIQADFINDILNDYIPEEYAKINIDNLNYLYNELAFFNHNEFGSFEFAIRYVYSYLMSMFFYDICDEKKNKEYYKEFLNNKNDYSARDIADLFGIDIDDSITLPSILILKYKNILEKNGVGLDLNPYITDDYLNGELEEYKRMINTNKNSNGLNQEQMILIRKLFHLYNKDKVSSNSYPFEIQSQVDDCDVDMINSISKKLTKIL